LGKGQAGFFRLFGRKWQRDGADWRVCLSSTAIGHQPSAMSRPHEPSAIGRHALTDSGRPTAEGPYTFHSSMFPIRDENPTLHTPVATIALIAANVVCWVLVQGMGSEPGLSRSVCELGLIPGEFLQRLPVGFQVPLGHGLACVVTPGRSWLAPLTSMFMHGSWFHLLGNMWFLWVFGNNVEDIMGRGRFLAFYVLCGLAAVSAQMAANPESPVPMVGASGAIGGVMGAYVLQFPRARIRTFMLIFFLDVPAYVMLGYWFLLQLGGSTMAPDGGGVAFWAHIGGFLSGIVLVLLFRDPELYLAHRQVARFP
jgi:membrane associated rhomboid family serine protease